VRTQVEAPAQRLRGPLGDFGDCGSAATRRLLNGRPGHAGTQHACDAGVARGSRLRALREPEEIFSDVILRLTDRGSYP
jgi:hypothetical protein